jgi:ribosomal protein S18 acetylase RimI-like enzyme
MVDDDLPFLAEVYASTRDAEMQMAPWSEREKEAFLRQQFDFQHRYYREHYPGCEFLVVERAGARIGRLYVDRWPDQIRIVDISLVPEARGAGVGGAVMRELLLEGAAARLPVTIHVEVNNPARRLYERLGFRDGESNGVYTLMRWTPASASLQEVTG